MRRVDRLVKSIALFVENVRPSRNFISAYLFGDRVVPMCI